MSPTAIGAGRANDELASYEAAWRATDIGKDLKKVRNVKPLWSRFGTVVGVGIGGLDMWLNSLFGFSPFGTLKHGKADYATLEPAARHKKIAYPKPDGVLTFDRLSSVFLSNTNHEENEPVHLLVADMDSAAAFRTRCLCRAFDTLLPGRRLRMGRQGWQRRRRSRGEGRALRHQRAELRPLQDLRHQGPEPEHNLGAATRWRGTGLSRTCEPSKPDRPGGRLDVDQNESA